MEGCCKRDVSKVSFKLGWVKWWDWFKIKDRKKEKEGKKGREMRGGEGRGRSSGEKI